ncbi:MAG TPA: hypothetical protein VGW38_22095, partial [Chloroflexota bacterium]|nr:hypothetical protein [Chloroflexota bacterium]
MSSIPKMAKYARYYGLLGWRMMPLYDVRNGRCTCHKGASCATPGKHPRITGWQHNASSALDT